MDNWDNALLHAANIALESSFLDLRGMSAKRKRDREDAALRRDTLEKCRADIAERILAQKSNPEQVRNMLERITSDTLHTANQFRDALFLADQGLLTVYLKTQVAGPWSNVVGGTTEFVFELTDEGRAVLSSGGEHE